MASYQYVYVMKDLTKAFPGGREVFKGITLAFLPGVKIGVLGVNGAGKSTLLKIMAGIETEFGGEAWAAEGARVGYLEQEPQLDPDKTVGENVEEAFAELKAALDRFNEISDEVRRTDERRGDEHAAGRTGRPAGEDRRRGRLGPRPPRRHRAGRAALPAGGRRRSPRCPAASGGASRCAGCCWKSPTCCCWTSRPTIWTPKASPGWSTRCSDYAGTVMIVTHDRYFLDNVTGWILEIERGRGYPFEGNYSSWLEQKRKRLQQEEKEESARQRALAAEQEWIAASPRARQAKNRARIQRYEEMLARSQEQAAGWRRSSFRRGRGSATW